MGYDTANFQLDVVHYHGGPGSFGGLGYVGGKGTWLKTPSLSTLVHELGHNLGLWHSNYWRSNTSPPSTVNRGQNVEYGNKFDVMGSAGNTMGHYVAPNKAELGWLPPDSYHAVKANGTYRIYQVDQGQADSDKRYALTTNRDSERDYWLEFRQGYPDNPNLFNGVMLTWDAWGWCIPPLPPTRHMAVNWDHSWWTPPRAPALSPPPRPMTPTRVTTPGFPLAGLITTLMSICTSHLSSRAPPRRPTLTWR